MNLDHKIHYRIHCLYRKRKNLTPIVLDSVLVQYYMDWFRPCRPFKIHQIKHCYLAPSLILEGKLINFNEYDYKHFH